MTAATRTEGESPRVAVRVRPAGLAFIDAKAAEHGLTRSWAIKTMLAYATRKMTPADWNAAK